MREGQMEQALRDDPNKGSEVNYWLFSLWQISHRACKGSGQVS